MWDILQFYQSKKTTVRLHSIFLTLLHSTKYTIKQQLPIMTVVYNIMLYSEIYQIVGLYSIVASKTYRLYYIKTTLPLQTHSIVVPLYVFHFKERAVLQPKAYLSHSNVRRIWVIYFLSDKVLSQQFDKMIYVCWLLFAAGISKDRNSKSDLYISLYRGQNSHQ